MYIKNEELDFLIKLENRLGAEWGWKDEDMWNLWKLNEELLTRRRNQNEYARNFVAHKRETDKSYARSKKDKLCETAVEDDIPATMNTSYTIGDRIEYTTRYMPTYVTGVIIDVKFDMVGQTMYVVERSADGISINTTQDAITEDNIIRKVEEKI